MPPRDAPDLTIFITSRDATCDECREDLGRGAWITLGDGGRAFCLACADLDHLAFLPAGDAALTRRARAHSTLSAVVLRWSRARKRYERQGLLVEVAALDRAEAQCLSDADARARRREREAERRGELDRDYLKSFADRVRETFPGAPPEREHEIAAHACRKYSGRVGRSAAAKALDAEAVHLAVAAHVRHHETDYDALLASGLPRHEARDRVAPRVREVLRLWRAG
ncbi:MAG: DUF2293 domain-containing protein [Trueperaceae bacterium]|nr:DUF2293 domain-containing protein [Trueperaceae bacterium]